MEISKIQEVISTLESEDYVLLFEVTGHDFKLRLMTNQVEGSYVHIFTAENFNESILRIEAVKAVNSFYERRFTQYGLLSEDQIDIVKAYIKQCRAIYPNFKVVFKSGHALVERWFGEEPRIVDTTGRLFTEFYEELLEIQTEIIKQK